MKHLYMISVPILCCLILMTIKVNAQSLSSVLKSSTQREKILLDFGWRFSLGDAANYEHDFDFGLGTPFAKAGECVGAVKPDFVDTTWRLVDLPHDWAVELDFVNIKDDDVMAHGYKPIGRKFPNTSIGWYRKSIEIPAGDKGKRISLKFDGVFRNSIVWINGHYLGVNLSGYSEFDYDITDYIKYGEKNMIVVRVDATHYEGWFYEGAGIYRHTWLIKHAPVHIPLHGVFVSSEVNKNKAAVKVQTEIFNQSDKETGCQLVSIVFDGNGNSVGEMKTDLSSPSYEDKTIEQTINVNNPELWSLERPYLYKLVSILKKGNNTVDRVETEFGIRTIYFDKDKGFFLNGKRVELKGVCCHQDHAGIGSALPDRMQYYRIERLKEMGCNAYRTSHNPPTPELLEACDRLGMLVMDENRLMGSTREFVNQFSKLIKRDRNHPSIIIWSIGNEEYVIHNTEIGKNIALSLKRVQEKLDPTRLCTYAANNGNHFEGINSVLDVRGFNYMNISDIDKYRKEHPKQILLGSEEASTLCTRGIYSVDKEEGYMSDYDLGKPGWGALAEQWYKFFAEREWLAGAFVWTGFDYRGEPTPYKWPCINSHFGIMDVCGYPKNIFYYYQAWWSDKDVLHIFPHWNWTGKIGEIIDVWCYSNCENVELFLNGNSLGKKTMTKNSHLEWKVKYEAGTLEAIGVRNGKTITTKIETTGEPVTLLLSPDRPAIKADGRDVCVLNVTAVDKKGNEVPVANNSVKFEITGKGKIIGVGNGNPSCHEPDKYLEGNYKRSLFNGKCQVIIQSLKDAGEITIKAVSDGLKTASIKINAE